MSLSLPHPGYLGRQVAPLVRAGTDSLKAVANILGTGQKAFAFSPNDVRATETFTLQRLAEGKPEYIGFSISTAMQSSNAAIIELMPMLRTNATTFVYEYFSFPKELAIATPAQAPPSYVEVEKRSREVTLDRYALGATTTVQELRTAEGQFIFRGKLITIAVAFIDVAELLAIDAFLTLPTLYAQYYIEAGQHPLDLQRVGRMTDLYFDIMRQRDNGFAELVDMIRQSMSQQNIAPTHVIMVEGMRSLMMASSMKTEYSRFGPGAAANAERLGDAVGDSFDGLRFIVVRAIELRKKDIRISPLERHVIIGGHARLDHVHQDCDPERWCSKFQTGQIFSMGTPTGSWATIGPMDALWHDGRFSKSDGRLSDWHFTLVESLDDWARKCGVPVYKQQYDMFVYLSRSTNDDQAASVANVCELWGHMEPWALSHKSADRTTQGCAIAARRNIPADSLAAIRLGLEDIRELYERKLTAEDRAWLRLPGEMGRYGVRALPTAGVGERRNYQPAGYGSVAGYLEIAASAGVPRTEYIDQGLVARAVAFKKAAVQLHMFFVGLYTSAHPALSPANAPAFYRRAQEGKGVTNDSSTRASLLNFFHNVVDTPKSNLYETEAGAEAAVGPSGWTALPELSTYNDLNAVIDIVGPAPVLVAAFGNEDAVARTEEAYENSTFRTRYDAYVTSLRTAAAGARRARRGAVSADVEAAEAFGDDEEGASALARFHRREIASASKALSAAQKAALYTRVLESVRTNRSPSVISSDLLAAWASDRTTPASATLQSEVPRGARPTGYTASLDALRASNLDGIFLASAVNPGRVVALAEAGAEMDGSGANTDLLRTSLTSGARPSPTAGVRDALAEQSRAETMSVFGGIGGSLPPFASSAFTDVVGDEIVVNTNIRDRFARYGGETNWLQRVSGQMFVLAPILQVVLKNMYDRDIPLPVAWLVEQFNRRYRSASMIFISKPSTRPFGNIRYMDADTHIGRNAINKNLMVHVSMYMNATPEDVQDWFIAHDVAIIGYDGGENTEPFDQDTFDINMLDKLPIDGPSLLYFMVPADSLVGKCEGKTPLTHDIRGSSDAINYRGASVHRESQFAERPYYKSALFYCSKLQLHRIVTPTADDWHRFHRREGTYNTVTHQLLQRVVNPHTLNYDLVIMPTDPFKTNVYPGCKELRESALPRVYKTTNYEEVSISI